MVRNHVEIARGKHRIVVNYKKHNDNTIFYGFFLPHKPSLIKGTTGKKIFSKFDRKSGFWQIKILYNIQHFHPHKDNMNGL